MAVCIDTNILIDYFRGHVPARSFLKKTQLSKTEIFFSAITEAELLSGQSCHDPEVRDVILSLLTNFTKIEVDNPIAQMAGYIRRSFGLTLADAIIAATALKLDAGLFTRNTKDFERIHHLVVERPYPN